MSHAMSSIYALSASSLDIMIPTVFDSNIATLVQNHKLKTADKAQVCDGSSWEALRDTSDSSPPNTKGIASQFAYHPSRNRLSRRSEPEVPIVSSEEREQGTMKSSFIPRPSFGDSDSEVGLDSQQHPETQDVSSKKDRDLRHDITEDRSDGPKRGSRRTSSEDLRPGTPNSDGATRPTGQPRRPSRRASSGDLRASPDGTSHRPSHRGSLGEISTDSSGSKQIMRKLSRPKHRCEVTNQNVSGIMRPARYSSNNLAGMTTQHPPRTISMNNLSTLGMSRSGTRNSTSNLSSLGLNRPGVRNSTSCTNFATDANGLRRNYHSNASFDSQTTKTTTSMSNATWVAHGVEFSKNMEVYVFRK